MVATNEANGGVVAVDVRLARYWLALARGLLGRRDLLPSEGLLLVGCASIHTWFMRFSIDVLFLDRSGVVVGLRRGLRPFRLAGAARAATTLELRTGAVDASGTAIGDRVVISEPAPATR
jgi:uncharacterized protein